jgi:hypothetical protein
VSVGNGTLSASYATAGELAVARLELIFGSSTSIASAVQVNLPVAAIASTGTVGHGFVYDASPATFYPISIDLFGSTTLAGLNVWAANSTYASFTGVAASVPITFTTSDRLIVSLAYLRA